METNHRDGAARLLLVRHGRTVGNQPESRIMLGRADIPLDPTGEREAQAIARSLCGEGPAAAIYSSPLARARATAEALAGVCGLSVRIEPDLAEIDCGEVDGLPLEEVEERYPAEWSRNLARSDADFRWPGGESYRELRSRTVAVLRRLAARHPGERVVVVTHAGVVAQAVGWLHGFDAARWDLGRPENGSVTEIRVAGERAWLTRFDGRETPDGRLPDG